MKQLCAWCGLEVYQEDGAWFHRDKIIQHLPKVNKKNLRQRLPSDSSTQDHRAATDRPLPSVGKGSQ